MTCHEASPGIAVRPFRQSNGNQTQQRPAHEVSCMDAACQSREQPAPLARQELARDPSREPRSGNESQRQRKEASKTAAVTKTLGQRQAESSAVQRARHARPCEVELPAIKKPVWHASLFNIKEALDLRPKSSSFNQSRRNNSSGVLLKRMLHSRSALSGSSWAALRAGTTDAVNATIVRRTATTTKVAGS